MSQKVRQDNIILRIKRKKLNHVHILVYLFLISSEDFLIFFITNETDYKFSIFYNSVWHSKNKTENCYHERFDFNLFRGFIDLKKLQMNQNIRQNNIILKIKQKFVTTNDSILISSEDLSIFLLHAKQKVVAQDNHVLRSEEA